VLSLYRIGAFRQLKSELEKYSIDIAAIQGIRWKGTGVMDTGNFTMYYSGNIGSTFGTGCLVRKKYKHIVIGFEPINERLCILRVRGKFNNTTRICAHTPTEEKDNESKETFYEKLDQICHKAPAHDAKIIIGDLNAKIGQEEIFRLTIGKWSLHDISNDNGLRTIDFATSNNTIIRSTYFRHKNIHRET
jgi:exonuclease III